MAFAALIPLIASAIPAIAGALGGGGGGGGGGARPTTTTTPGTGTGTQHPVTVVHSPAHPTTGPASPAVLSELATGIAAPQHSRLSQRHAEALNTLHTDQVGRTARTEQARLARDQVRETRAAIQPELDAIHSQLSQRSRQIQATAEHRDLVAQQAFRQTMENGLLDAQRRLRALQTSVDRLARTGRRY